MSTCTFFGHRDCPESVRPVLKSVLTELITGHSVFTFYVGNQGRFDSITLSTLRELKQTYPHISYFVVLAYLPNDNDEHSHGDTIFPEGIESIHPRWAIAWRNKWFFTESWGMP